VLARAVKGAVTIEDATSHVLAYSTLEDDELDAPRREAILGRRVPMAYLRHLRSEASSPPCTPLRMWCTSRLTLGLGYGVGWRLQCARMPSCWGRYGRWRDGCH
jgi:hypothetical protein